MKSSLTSLAKRLLVVLFVLAGSRLAQAQLTYTWDPNGATHSEAGGTWGTTAATTDWNNGSANNQPWPTSGTPPNAVFGWGTGSAGTPAGIKVGTALSVGNITFALTGSSSAGYTLSASGSGVITFGGTIINNNTGAKSVLQKLPFSMSAGVDFTMQGSGTTLVTACTYTGGTGNTHIEGGTVQLTSSANGLNTTGLLTLDTGATFDMNGQAQQLAGLAQTSGIGGMFTNTGGSSVALTLAPATATSYTFSGPIGASTASRIKLTMQGTDNTSVQTLTGTSTFTGVTTVTTGTLLNNGTLGATAMTVNGGEFGGTGTCGSTLTYAGGAGNFTITSQGSSSPLTVSSTLTLPSTAFTIHLNAPANLATTFVYTLASSSSANISGTPSSFPVTFDSGGLAAGATGVASISGHNLIYTVTAPATSASTSTCSASPGSVTADGSTTSTITVTLLTSGSVPVSGKTVTLASSRGATDTISAASGPSDSNGHVTFTVTSTTAGTANFTATDTTDSITVTQQASVTFTAGAVSASTSTVVANPTGVAADGSSTSTITVTLLDAHNNPVSGKTVTLASSRGATDTITTTQGTTDSNGHATFTVSSTTTGTPAFTATDTSDSLTITQTATVNFTATPSASNSTAVASPTTGVTADGSTTSTITVTVLDSTSTPIQGVGVSGTSTGSGNTISSAAATDATGKTTFTIASTKAETKTITVTAGGVQLNQQPTVQFVAGAVSASASTVSGTSPVTADGSSTSTITVTVTDAQGNPISGITVTLASSRGAVDTISAASGPSDSNGHVTFTATSKTAGSPAFTATDTTDSLTFTHTGSVTFVAGTVTQLQILLPGETAAPGTVSGKTGTPGNEAVGLSFSAIINAVDANWNVVSSATPTVNFISTDGSAVLPANGTTTLVAGTKTVSLTLNTVGPQTVTVSDAASVLTSDTSGSATVVGSIKVITLTVASNSVSPWAVPAGVSTIQVQMWGGGGSGGGVAASNGHDIGGGGGGGGGYALASLNVTPLSSISYFVGGGAPVTTGVANGSSGTNTTFTGVSAVASGGGGGTEGTSASPNGAGGAAGVGTTFNGGAGGAGSSTVPAGGGGGGGAGAGGAGGAGSPLTGGAGGAAVGGLYGGGAGGTSTSSSGVGVNPGAIPGGGGAGAYESGTTSRPGTNGANGQIVITYPLNTAGFSGLTASQSIFAGASPITLSGTVSAPGPLYPAAGETVTVTIDGNAQTTTTSDAFGDFSISYNSSSIPASATPYTITYSYGGDAALSSATDTSTTLTVSYPFPTLNAAFYNRVQNMSLKMKISDLLTNAADADSLITLSLGYISPSTNGTALFDDGTYIYYTNSTPVNVNDAFQYYVLDGHGNNATNFVFISIIQTNGQQTPQISVSGSSVQVTFFGVPGYLYDVERNTNLTMGAGWVDITNVTTPVSGVFTITDTFSDIVPSLLPSPPPSAYYRLLVP